KRQLVLPTLAADSDFHGNRCGAFGRPLRRQDVVKSVAKQTAAGLKFIHDKDVVHRDLKAENILVCAQQITATTPVKLIDFGVAKSLSGTIARSCVGTTEIMAPELVSAKLMIAPKGASMKKHGPYTFKSPQEGVHREASPGFGIVTQRPDGKGAMVNGIEPGGQAAGFNVGDGWAISSINGTEILEMPFVKDFNELGAGTKAGVTAIAEILGNLNGPFTCEFVELPKREFTKSVDLWSLGVTMYVMLTGVKPFTEPSPVERRVSWVGWRVVERGEGLGRRREGAGELVCFLHVVLSQSLVEPRIWG
ncbi:Mitogen-activated protein kinase kinase kinase 1 (ARAKIN) (AtMEKK1) (MAP kinase kinase kinase 1), partial [Durusdinium trenchii]